jgi:hypothetical protein
MTYAATTTKSIFPLSLKHQWEGKTNRLLTFAIDHCQQGDRFNLWYSWNIEEHWLHVLMWWKFHLDNDCPDWDANVDWHLIQKARQTRIQPIHACLAPQFKLSMHRLHPSLKCVNMIIK